MSNGKNFYHVQFLFDNRRARDKAYGREMPLSLDVSLADESYEILYRQKGQHKTGARNWLGVKEKLPTIELVVGLNGHSKISDLHVAGFREGHKKNVNYATLSFTTKSYDPVDVDTFSSELEEECDSLSLKPTLNVTRYSDAGFRYAYLDGAISGPVREVIIVNDFAIGQRLKLASHNMTFY